MINYESWCTIKTLYGTFRLYESSKENLHCLLLSCGDIKRYSNNPLVRIQSSCITSEVFKSLDCDCNDQLLYAMERIQSEGYGLIFYLFQEGRGQGLDNKIKGMRLMEDKKITTYDAYASLNLEQDVRDYSNVITILKDLNFDKVRLLTNNPRKMNQLQNNNIEVERIEHIPPLRDDFVEYLKSKRDQLNHLINHSFEMNIKKKKRPVDNKQFTQ